MKYISLIFALSMTLSACGSDTATTPTLGESTAPDSFGFLLDSAVEGLRYRSGTHHGVTNAEGRFGYVLGENIEFYIGNNLIAFADTPAERLTPYEFSTGSPFSTIDVLRLLQSIDDDGDPSNGIKISEAVNLLAESVTIEPVIDFNFPPDNIDPGVIMQLTSVTTAGTRGVVSNFDAYLHFASTLDRLIDELEVDIRSLADNTTCSSSDQCAMTELESKYTFYCPPVGPSIAYSNIDIDQSQFDALIAERAYLITAKTDVNLAAGDNNTPTGLCIRNDPPITLVCNAANHCETQ